MTIDAAKPSPSGATPDFRGASTLTLPAVQLRKHREASSIVMRRSNMTPEKELGKQAGLG
jgi:hypothetical protein